MSNKKYTICVACGSPKEKTYAKYCDECNKCPKCSRKIRPNNLKRHVVACGNVKTTKTTFSVKEWLKDDGLYHCPECGETYEKYQSMISHYFRRHTLKGQQHDPNIELKNGLREPTIGYSRRYEYKGVLLQSSYELKVAKSLDANGVLWSRDKSFSWVDINGKQRRYFPDFYLLDYDVFLDPKNDYLMVQDADKISRVMEQNNITVIMLSKHELAWDYIKPKI